MKLKLNQCVGTALLAVGLIGTNVVFAADAYQGAFQANTGSLWNFSPSSGGSSWNLGMMKGSSPGMAALSDGGYQTVFQANTTNLWSVGAAGNVDTKLGMMPGTSPAVAASPKGGYQAAFQANTGSLWVYSPATGGSSWNLGMMKGTSPAIAALPDGGYQIAFQANTSSLWSVGAAGNIDAKLGMMPGTSPSIAASPKGGYQVVFQANTGNLWKMENGFGADLRLGMRNGTSPAIAALTGGGYQIAFQANTSNLWVIGAAGNADTGLGMMAGTSPTIAALPGGSYQVLFQANTGEMWRYSPSTGVAPVGLGMMAGTSPAVAALSSGAVPSIVFSQYKEISTGGIATNGLMRTRVNGITQAQTDAMPARNTTLTWAFAAGACGSETWNGFAGSIFAAVNVPAFVNAGKKYIVSTGGAGQKFTCSSDAGFDTFIRRYNSANLIGVDFDIEYTQTASEIDNLVQRVITAQRNYPNLRFSFTIATLGGNRANSLNSLGATVMQTIKNRGLKNVLINLMVMDYGSNAAGNCTLKSNGLCDMGASAVQAAKNLNNYYGVPYNQIELTPLIGENDIVDEIFTIADANTVSSFVRQNGLAGVHFWAFDRDVDCPFNPVGPSATCNGVGNAGRLGYTNTFLNGLGF